MRRMKIKSNKEGKKKQCAKFTTHANSSIPHHRITGDAEAFGVYYLEARCARSVDSNRQNDICAI